MLKQTSCSYFKKRRHLIKTVLFVTTANSTFFSALIYFTPLSMHIRSFSSNTYMSASIVFVFTASTDPKCHTSKWLSWKLCHNSPVLKKSVHPYKPCRIYCFNLWFTQRFVSEYSVKPSIVIKNVIFFFKKNITKLRGTIRFTKI